MPDAKTIAGELTRENTMLRDQLKERDEQIKRQRSLLGQQRLTSHSLRKLLEVMLALLCENEDG